MTPDINALSLRARKAAQVMDWNTVSACAREIMTSDDRQAEGHFLFGLAEKALQRPANAITAFRNTLQLDPGRYDAAIELAHQFAVGQDAAAAKELVDRYESYLDNSPRYLDLAGTVFTSINLHERAWPLYKKASELQPNVDVFESNLAHCASTLGKIDIARELYQGLLQRRPEHQRNHYALSRLATAEDDLHIRQMQALLTSMNLPPERNVFMYYALGKELEDLGRWDEAFEYYRKGGDAVSAVSTYKIEEDLELLEAAAELATPVWIAKGTESASWQNRPTPIFVIGLPRTGTTLTERILSSHSLVESVGETQFMEIGIRRASGVQSTNIMDPSIMRAFNEKGVGEITDYYLNATAYLLDDARYFVEKLPYNFIYAGFMARAYPDAPIIHLRRHPMDACFAMYKQVFTWAFRFSYSFEQLAQYYVAYDRLMQHWRDVLGDRLIEVNYEDLVSDQEAQVRRLLDRSGLDFEQACIDFHQNRKASATASSIQVREKVHTRSVNRWKNFESQLKPLHDMLVDAGIKMQD